MKSNNPESPRPPGPKKSKLISAAESKIKQLRDKVGLSAKPKAKAAPVPAAAAKARRTPKGTRLNIPPILLEGDSSPGPAAASGPGERYSLGPTPPVPQLPSAGGALPEAYGTQQLFLTARDPHWVYAHWDLTREQLKKYNSLSAEGHLVLRVYRGALDGAPLSEIPVHPESRHWFVHVPEAGVKYLGDLGYYDSAHRWVTLARSGPTVTPPDSLSEDTAVRFATIPSDVPFAVLLSTVKSASREHVPLVEAIQQMRAQGFKDLPAPEQMGRPWTPAQENALAEIVSMDQVRRIWIGSLEITELIRRQLQQNVSSISAAQFGWPTSPVETSSVSSPFGGREKARGFWFNVNAELIIYGATEPGATVTIGERSIKLRPDGSFSFRFALPDGEYSLPAAAHSADGEETRQAHLQFSRETEYQGDVGAHPQDKRLQPPLVSAVA
ncbi:MAG TPA: DUF4912 domain-containing protein [Candidatus Saccharimonadales bacterium]|nr:DUF4912 domain-containing protein [Candidatus Saccharimonadales bacterium]